MRTPVEPRRSHVSLTVASPTEPSAEPLHRIPYVPWLVADVLWTAAAALLGLVLVGVPVSVSWLTAVHLPAADVVATIGQGWLALHGVPVVLGGATLRMVPLGLAALVALSCSFAAHHAGGQYGLASGASARARWLAWAAVTLAGVGSYVVVGLTLAAVLGSPAQVGASVPGLVLLPLVGSGAGAFTGLGLHPFEHGPVWLRRLPGAVGLGVGVLTIAASAALALALWAHWDRVVQVHDSLQPDAVGAVVLVLVQAAYLPNLLAAAGSFVLGAGVTLGGGVLAPGVVVPAVLPAIPVLGAVPGVPGVADWAWPAVGVLAGASSAWWVVRGAEAAWLPSLGRGTLAGVLPGLAWIAVCWVAGGDLGVGRLVGFGARWPDVLLWGTVPLALAGGLFGLGRALVLSRRAPARGDAASR